MNGTIAYRQQFTRCGKQRCRKCKEGEGHGPYWYAYWSENGRTKTKYIGVRLTEELSIEAYTQGWAVAWNKANEQERHLTYRLWAALLHTLLHASLHLSQERKVQPHTLCIIFAIHCWSDFLVNAAPLHSMFRNLSHCRESA